jgi:hypothetical protein
MQRGRQAAIPAYAAVPAQAGMTRPVRGVTALRVGTLPAEAGQAAGPTYAVIPAQAGIHRRHSPQPPSHPVQGGAR